MTEWERGLSQKQNVWDFLADPSTPFTLGISLLQNRQSNKPSSTNFCSAQPFMLLSVIKFHSSHPTSDCKFWKKLLLNILKLRYAPSKLKNKKFASPLTHFAKFKKFIQHRKLLSFWEPINLTSWKNGSITPNLLRLSSFVYLHEIVHKSHLHLSQTFLSISCKTN